ncbi:MAG: hypothetical protein J6V25_07140 [Oscillospiraceae bacterium]|nr:hypothetical protein [Oscillospiraceae bacterium]
MENLNPEIIAELSENEIETVVGGTSTFDSILVGDRVKAADGRVCPNCGGTIGTVEMLNYVTKVVKCEKCRKHIFSFTNPSQVVKV